LTAVAIGGKKPPSYITKRFYTVRANHLDATFAALADPTRRALLARLATGEAGVTQLAKPFDMSQPAISKHLKVLERAGLIVRGRRAQSRPCRLQAAPLREVADWVERYRRYWEQSFDRLDAYLGKLQQQDKSQRQEKRRGRKSTN
jgi:DNA-binding transcriptional ArsR family regulator